MVKNSLWRVETPRFCAGLYMIGDRIDHAAPIIKWLIGKDREFLHGVAKRCGWVLHEVKLESVPLEYLNRRSRAATT